MKIVFFDMEFANGRIPGSVYSLGYVQTNDRFELTEPQTDLLINPDCEWNAYVRSHILAYSMSTVKAASLFPAYYKRLKKLLCHADLVVGFAVKNDTTALEKACERYGLKPLSFQCLDMERLCKSMKDYPQAHGLAGYVRSYCGVEPDHQHRSDGDAFATMMLLKEICKRKGISPKKIKKEFAQFILPSITPAPKKTKKKNTEAPAETEAENRMSLPRSRNARRNHPTSGRISEVKQKTSAAKEQNGEKKAPPVSPSEEKAANAKEGQNPSSGARRRRRHHNRNKRTSLPKSALPQSKPSSNGKTE